MTKGETINRQDHWPLTLAIAFNVYKLGQTSKSISMEYKITLIRKDARHEIIADSEQQNAVCGAAMVVNTSSVLKVFLSNDCSLERHFGLTELLQLAYDYGDGSCFLGNLLQKGCY